ncbi:MAG TPA: tail fiber domain-containing protein [Candidatus Udaeobacter sp.]
MKNRRITLIARLVVLACSGLSIEARAVTPAPDGCYSLFTTAEGCNALEFLTTGVGNTAVGWYSLSNTDSNSFNTGLGAGALCLNIGDANTAVGTAAMLNNFSGFENVANGYQALLYNTTGSYNNALGAFALYFNMDGSFNNAVGNQALAQNVHAGNNTAIGDLALATNDYLGDNVAYFNTAVGAQALYSNVDGNSNTAVGWQALYYNDNNCGNNDCGSFNTATGGFALFSNVSGARNTAIGYSALSGAKGESSVNDNTAVGFQALFNNFEGNRNTAVGVNAGSNISGASNVICIGANVAGANTPDTCFIGNIRGVTTINNDAIPVRIDSAGQLGTESSSRRYKTDIKPIEKASESILSLKPVSFRYKIHKDSTPNFGLIAEEVARVNPDLVIFGPDGKPYTVRYEAVNAMLLNEFLKEHRRVENQESRIERQEATIAQQQKQIDTLTAGLNRVSAELELSKSAPQTVLNNQ